VPGGGVDAAPAAVQAARAEAVRRAGADHHAGSERRAQPVPEFTVADAYALPFADGSYDVAHALQLLQHLGDPVAALREMARVTRPGGLIAVRDVDFAAMTWYPASEPLTRWLTAYRALARSNGGEPDAGRQLRAWARAAGLTDVTATASAWSYGIAAEMSWWAGCGRSG